MLQASHCVLLCTQVHWPSSLISTKGSAVDACDVHVEQKAAARVPIKATSYQAEPQRVTILHISQSDESATNDTVQASKTQHETQQEGCTPLHVVLDGITLLPRCFKGLGQVGHTVRQLLQLPQPNPHKVVGLHQAAV